MREGFEEDLLEGLRALAGELHGHLDGMRRKIASIESDRANILAMLKFQEEVIVGSAYLPHISVRRVFRPRELRDYCFRALQASEGMLDTRELALACMARKGMDTADILVRRKVVCSVIHALKSARRNGQVESCGKRKGVLLWRMCGGVPISAGRRTKASTR